MFAYYPRKQEDIDLFKKLQREKRELVSEYQDKRSEYDKDLERYNLIIRKLDKLKTDSDEYKGCVSELEGLVIKLKPVDKVEDSTKSTDTDEPQIVKPKPKRQYAKKAMKVPTILINDVE